MAPAHLHPRVAPQAFILVWLLVASSPSRGEDSTSGMEFFENHIRPVLVDNCYACHSQEADMSEGDLVLDNRAGVARGGQSGEVIVPGNPAASKLLAAISHRDPSLEMPPGDKLPDDVISNFQKWIELGAPDPRDGTAPPPPMTIASEAKSHWAFQRPTRPAVPENDGDSWSRNDIDRLIYEKLIENGLTPSDEATRRTLIRRLYYDLIGLPPTYDEIAAFVADDSPEAYESLVERLLDSSQFGERWARHWLDVARFADTKGYVFTQSRDYPHAYKFRDWVIAAFNDDMPIDEFLQYQLAADHLVKDDEDQHHLAAHGYLTLGRRFINNRHDIIDDRIDVVFRGMLGLTASCARCHDHKFDPVSIEDYYALYGIFNSSQEVQDEELPLRLTDKDEPGDVKVFIRGNAANRGDIAPRGFPQFMAFEELDFSQGSGRLQLAQAIASPENPLTARVFVNRVWGHLFGDTLLRTPSDLGLRTEPPRQQEVLDLLATDFMENGWSLKTLVRELVLSSTYRLSSEVSQEQFTADPENELWSRRNRRRLDFESMRDTLLLVSDRLEGEVGGPSEQIQTPEGGKRRTLYAHIDRQNLPGIFRTFDFASPDTHSPERPHTLVPQQSLFLMNSPMVQTIVGDLAKSFEASAPDAGVTMLFRRILGRDPEGDEIALAVDFLQNRSPAAVKPESWSFGYGHISGESAEARVHFEEFTHFTGDRWQISPEFPDEKFGHLSLTADGGHPGGDETRSTIRRWTAPRDGTVHVTGELEHPNENGDGVQGSIVSSRQGKLGQWVAANGKQSTELNELNVNEGEHLDFVTDCREGAAYDSFNWRVKIGMESDTEPEQWLSPQGFRGPRQEPLSLEAQLAQVLILSNEFIFVD